MPPFDYYLMTYYELCFKLSFEYVVLCRKLEQYWRELLHNNVEFAKQVYCFGRDK
jgi:hypothetical protein